MPDVRPKTQRGFNARLVSVNLWSFPHKVRLLRFHKTRSFEELESSPKYDAHKAHSIVGEKCTDIEFVEDGISVNSQDDGEENEAGDSDIGLTPAFVGKRVSRDALCLQRTIEEEVDRAHENIIEELRRLGDVCKPLHALGSCATNTKEAKEGEEHRNAEAIDGYTLFGCLLKETRRMPVNREGIERPGCAVHIRVACIESAS